MGGKTIKRKAKRFEAVNGKEFFITGLGQCIYLLQNVVQNKLFTSYFATSVFGEWSLLVSVYTLISMLPFSAIDQGIYKLAYECKDKGNEQQLYSVISIVYAVGFGIYSSIFFGMAHIQRENFFANGYAVPFLLYAFSEIIKNSLLLVDNAFRYRTKVLGIRIFGISSRTVLFVLFYKLNIFSITNVLWILVITNIIILIMEKEYFRKITLKLDKDICKSIMHSIISFSAPLMTWAIFGWMQNMISRWYLNSVLDLESVAMYSVLTTLSYFVPNAIYTVVNAYIMPIVFEHNSAFSKSKLLKYLGCVGGVLFTYILFVTVIGKYLILFLTDDKYIRLTQYLPFTTLTASLYVLAMLSTVEIYRRGQTKKLIISTILPGLFMATVGYFLIKQWKFNGSIINYMLGHIIYAILTAMVVFNKKNLAK